MNLIFYFLAIILSQTVSLADIWNLPSPLSDSNVNIRFEVDSTWHLIKGKTKNVQGKAWLSDPKDFKSINIDISIPVNSFDTNDESRDEEMREIMHSEKFPLVQFQMHSPVDIYNPKEVAASQEPLSFPCQGNLSISGVTKLVPLIATISKAENDYIISGSTTIKWSDFSIEDPSILIAKLHPDVLINFSLSLPQQKTQATNEGNNHAAG